MNAKKREDSDAGQGQLERIAVPDRCAGVSVSRYVLGRGAGFIIKDLHVQPGGRFDACAHTKTEIVVCTCIQGKVRFELPNGDARELHAGDVGIVSGENTSITTTIPDGTYAGVDFWFDAAKVPMSGFENYADFDLELLQHSVVQNQGLLVLAGGAGLAPTAREIVRGLRASEIDRGLMRLKAMELMVRCDRIIKARMLCDEAGDAPQTARWGRSQVARRAQSIMAAHLAQPLSVEEVARACDASVTMLKKAFQESCGTSPATWYRSYRIRRACDLLLNQHLSVGEVSRAVGYTMPGKFSRAFEREMGCLPSVWRTAHRGDWH